MVRYGLACLVLGALSWGQTPNTSSKPPATEKYAVPNVRPVADVPPATPVITIAGLCPKTSVDKSAGADCKTVITRAEFEKVIDAVQPGMPARVRGQFATNYARALVMSNKAVELGLDRGPAFEEKLRVARIQILNGALNKAIKDRASQIFDKEIEEYYHNNISKFEQVDLERVYIPRRPRQDVPDARVNMTDKELGTQESTDGMKTLAEKLRGRAVAGEDFTKLQSDAYRTAGMKSTAPGVEMEKTMRSALPPNQVFVFELKTGEISPVIEDQSGYFLYKVKSKSAISLDEASEEIRDALRAQRTEDELMRIQESAKPSLNETYFASPQRQENGKPASNPSDPDPDDD